MGWVQAKQESLGVQGVVHKHSPKAPALEHSKQFTEVLAQEHNQSLRRLVSLHNKQSQI